MTAGDLATSRLAHWRRKLRFRREHGEIYKALNSKEQEFRLLLLYAGLGDDPIRAQLRPTRFKPKRQAQYETISYCWGDPNKTVQIQLNKETISVPASSAAALRCVRLPDRDRVLWIDALCIDQSNLDERSQQVAMMSDIYSKSTGNLVYLGETNSVTEQAVDSIRKITADIMERTRDYSSVKGTALDHQHYPRFSYDDVSLAINQKALLYFFSNGWFRRVWAFQEAALSPFNVCYIGHLRLALLDIVRAAAWIRFYKSSYSYKLRVHDGVRCADNLFDLSDRNYGFYAYHKPLLDVILVKSRHLLATEPRDHVYGILGLWNQEESTVSKELQATLGPDYQKPVEHVFRDATRAALEESHELFIWRHISYLDEADLCFNNSPSWMIDLNRDFDDDSDPNRFPEHFTANDNQRFTHSTIIPSDFDLLLLPGICLDHVVDVTTVLGSREFRKSEEMISSWTSNLFTTVYKNVEKATIEDISIVLLAGYIDRKRATSEDVQDTVELLQGIMKEHKLPTSHTEITPAASDQENRRADIRNQIKDICVYRRVFVTKTGYIGVGPKLMQPGDHVAVLYGGRVPLVLRPHNDEYRLLGECYVQGVMDGEAMRRHKDSGNPDTEFRIR